MNKRKMNRGNLFFEYTKKNGQIWWKGRFPKFKKPGGRSPERDLISLDQLPKTAQDFKAELTKLWFIKQQEIEKEREEKTEVSVTEEADRHTLSDAVEKAFTVGKYMDLLASNTKKSYKQQLNHWESLVLNDLEDEYSHLNGKKLGEYKLSEIDSFIIDQGVDLIKKSKNVGSTTINRYLSSLSALLGTYCHEFKPKWMKSNPCSWKEIKRTKEEKKIMIRVSLEERKNFLEYCSEELRFAVNLAIKTSARQQEIWGLRWENVSFRNKWITFHHTKNGSPRTVPILNNDIWEIFKKMFSEKEKNIDYVFPSHIGSKKRNTFRFINKPKSLKKQFETARDKSGLKEKLHWHLFRHIGITDMIHAGVNREYAKQVAGHLSDASMKPYLHTNPIHLYKELRKLEDYQNECDLNAI